MLLLLLNYVVLRALWKIDVHLISTLVNKIIYYVALINYMDVSLFHLSHLYYILQWIVFTRDSCGERWYILPEPLHSHYVNIVSVLW